HILSRLNLPRLQHHRSRPVLVMPSTPAVRRIDELRMGEIRPFEMLEELTPLAVLTWAIAVLSAKELIDAAVDRQRVQREILCRSTAQKVPDRNTWISRHLLYHRRF